MSLHQSRMRDIEAKKKAANAPQTAPSDALGKAAKRVTLADWLPNEVKPQSGAWADSPQATADSLLLRKNLGMFQGMRPEKETPYDPSSALSDSTAAWKLMLADPEATAEQRQEAQRKLLAINTAGKEPETVSPLDLLKTETETFKKRALSNLFAGKPLTPEQELALPTSQRLEKPEVPKTRTPEDAITEYLKKKVAADKQIDDVGEFTDTTAMAPALDALRGISDKYGDSLVEGKHAQALGFTDMDVYIERKTTVKTQLAEYNRIAQQEGATAANQYLANVSGGRYDITVLKDWNDALSIGKQLYAE